LGELPLAVAGQRSRHRSPSRLHCTPNRRVSRRNQEHGEESNCFWSAVAYSCPPNRLFCPAVQVNPFRFVPCVQLLRGKLAVARSLLYRGPWGTIVRWSISVYLFSCSLLVRVLTWNTNLQPLHNGPDKRSKCTREPKLHARKLTQHKSKRMALRRGKHRLLYLC
jgi:hypothetical protein